MRSATLIDRVDLDLRALEAAVRPLGFPSRAEVAVTAGLVAESVGLVDRRRRPAELGQRYYMRVSPGTVGLRSSMIWDATEGYEGRCVLRGTRIAEGPWAGHRYIGEIAGKDRTRMTKMDDAWAAGEVEAATAVLRSGLGEVQVYGPRRAAGRRVKAWSRRSRERMSERVAELDYSAWMTGPGMLAMVTYTLPECWEAITPRGRTFKRLVDRLRKRWIEATDENGNALQWRGLWKLEFQRRGAPHLHTLMRVPAMVNGRRFEEWIAEVWSSVVLDSLEGEFSREYQVVGHHRKHLYKGTDVSFSGVKYSDPRRTAVYFAKHASKSSGSKEYQHVVPEAWQAPDAGPGRFWGYWGLRRAVAEFELEGHQAVAAKRVLRHVARARQAASALNRLRSAGHRDQLGVLVGLAEMGRPRRRGGFRASVGGWVLVNDGLALAWDVGRYLAQT